MPEINIETLISAPAEKCFDLMRDVRLHTQTTLQTNEKAVAGVVDGMIGLGQTVTFEGTHFGVRQRLKVKVTVFERPRLFVDEMIEGTFRSFRHVHEFSAHDGVTLMKDTVIWKSPFGVFGKLVDKLLLERHLRNLITTRNNKLKDIAERSQT